MKKKLLTSIILIASVSCISILYLCNNKKSEYTESQNNHIEENNICDVENKVEVEEVEKVEKVEEVKDSGKNENIDSTKDNINKNDKVSDKPQSITVDTKSNNDNKSVSKKDVVLKILNSELEGQSIPKYCIPVKAINDDYNNLEKIDSSNAFLCNDDNKIDNGIIIELQNYNESNEMNYFIIRDYDAIKNGGKGLIGRGSISKTGEVEFSDK